MSGKKFSNPYAGFSHLIIDFELGASATDRWLAQQPRQPNAAGKGFTLPEILRFADMLGVKRDMDSAIYASGLLLAAHRIVDTHPEAQSAILRSFKNVIAHLTRREGQRLSAVLSVYEKIEAEQNREGVRGMALECEKTVTKKLESAAGHGIANAARFRKQQATGLDELDFYRNLLSQNVARLPAESGLSTLFIQSYTNTSQKLAEINLDLATYLDTWLASQLPENIEMTQIAIANYSRHMRTMMYEAVNMPNTDEELAFIAQSCRELKAHLTETNPKFLDEHPKFAATLDEIESLAMPMPAAADRKGFLERLGLDVLAPAANARS